MEYDIRRKERKMSGSRTVKRVTKKAFENYVDDKKTEGYKLKSKTDRQAVLVKRNYGRALWHFLIFIFAGWWTFLTANLVYLLFAYFVQKDEIQVKLKQSK